MENKKEEIKTSDQKATIVHIGEMDQNGALTGWMFNGGGAGINLQHDGYPRYAGYTAKELYDIYYDNKYSKIIKELTEEKKLLSARLFIDQQENERLKVLVKEAWTAGRNYERSSGITEDWEEFCSKNKIGRE